MDDQNNNTTDANVDSSTNGEDSITNYSVWQILSWFVIIGVATYIAVWFRSKIIRVMLQRVEEMPTTAQTESKKAPQSRQEFVDQTLSSLTYQWGEDSENGKVKSAEPSENLEPNPEQEEQANATEKEVTNGCAICLSNFHGGDSVCKSNNPGCSHVFHRDCLYDWLLQHHACPMCRNDFILPPFIADWYRNNKTTTDNNNNNSMAGDP